MKNVISRVEQVENKVLKTADTITFEGAPAWKMSDAERLNQYAMTGVLGRTFYVSQKDIIDEAIDLIKRSDASDLAKAIVIGRNIGYIRAFPILGLVYLSMKDSDLFKKTFPLVIYTGDDLENFIDLTRKTRGFGRSIKSAINDCRRPGRIVRGTPAGHARHPSRDGRAHQPLLPPRQRQLSQQQPQ